VQALAGGLACIAILGLARRLYGRLAGVLAGGVMAVYPFVIYFTGETLTETFFIALMSTSFYLVMRVVQNPTRWAVVCGGLTLGMGALCRPPAFMFVLAILVAAVWMRCKGSFAVSRSLLLCGIVATLIVTPWCVRNSVLFGRPTFLVSNSGLNLYKGLPGKGNDSSIADLGYCEQWIEDANQHDLPASERELDARGLAYWIDFTRAHPMAFVAQKVRDVGRFWFDFHLGGSLSNFGGLVLVVSTAMYLCCLVLSVVQTILCLRKGLGSRVIVPWIIIGLGFASYLPFFAGKRFRVASVDPYLVVLAASLLADRMRAFGPWRRLRRRFAG